MRRLSFWGILPRDWNKDNRDEWQLLNYLINNPLSESRGEVRHIKHLDESVVRIDIDVYSEKGY